MVWDDMLWCGVVCVVGVVWHAMVSYVDRHAIAKPLECYGKTSKHPLQNRQDTIAKQLTDHCASIQIAMQRWQNMIANE